MPQLSFRWMIVLLLPIFGLGCHLKRSQTGEGQTKSEGMDYHYGGYSERIGDGFRNIDAMGDSVIQSYVASAAKGPLTNGQRISLLADRSAVQVGDTVRLFHVFEDQRVEAERYVMGPKEIHGLWVDGVRMGPAASDAAYPDVMIYDGRVLNGPGWDYNFEFSRVIFATKGEHLIQWESFGLMSNVVQIQVQGGQ